MSAPARAGLRPVPQPIDAGPEDLQAPAEPHGGAAVAAVLLVLATVGTGAAHGLYDAVEWHVAGLALLTVLGVACVSVVPAWSRPVWVTVLAWAGFCAWNAASIAWSVGPSRSWVEADRALLYLAFLGVALIAFRTAAARLAAQTALPLAIAAGFGATLLVGLLGNPSDLFVLKRLDAPLGYINGVAGLAVIAFWPAVALAERSARPLRAGLGAGSAALLLGVMVLTQSRSVVPALLLSAAVVLAVVPGRLRRVLVLAIVAAGAAATAPFTFEVFAQGRDQPFAAPAEEVARAALVAVLVGAVAVGAAWSAFAGWARSNETRAATIGRVLAVVLGLGVVGGGVALGPAMVDRADRAVSDFRSLRVDESTSSRFASGGGNRAELWRAALAQWRTAPVVGIGAGGYGIRWYEERRVNEAIRQPHSLPLQVLAELGLIGAGLLLLAAAGVAAAAARALRLARGPEDLLIVAGALGSVVAWGVHTSLDWMYNLPAVTGAALVGMAALLAASSAKPGAALRATESDGAAAASMEPDGFATAGAGAPSASRARFARLIALAALAAAVASLGVQLAVSAYTSRAEGQLAASPERARESAERAVRLDGAAVPAWIVLAAAEARLGSYERSDSALRQITVAEPDSYVGYALRGDLATRAGLPRRAKDFYRRASERNPRDVGLAQLAGREPVQ